MKRVFCLMFLFFWVPFSLFSYLEEKEFQKNYMELGAGYPLLVFNSSRLDDKLSSNDWEPDPMKFSLWAGYYYRIDKNKWLMGIQPVYFSYQYLLKNQPDSVFQFKRLQFFLTSKYFLLGEIGDGFYIADHLGISWTNASRKGDGVEGSVGFTAGFCLGAGAGYAFSLSGQTSLLFNLSLLWDAIGATTSDGYPLDSKSLHFWIGILF